MPNFKANRLEYVGHLAGATSPEEGAHGRASFIRLRPPAPGPRLDLAGSRRVVPETTTVFLIDPEGYRRRVPNFMTYNRLFRSWHALIDDSWLDDLSERPAFTTGAILVRGEPSPAVFLLAHGQHS